MPAGPGTGATNSRPPMHPAPRPPARRVKNSAGCSMAASQASSMIADDACIHTRERTKLTALARCHTVLAIVLTLAALPGTAGAAEFIREDIRVPMLAAGPRGLEGIVVRTDQR